MLRKTLGWVNEAGDPIQERHAFTFRELEEAAGVSHSRLGEAISDAVEANFIRCIQKARVQTQGVKARSASFELRWDEDRYTDKSEEFKGFFLQPTYLDQAGQTRLGRKNIPNIFFDYLIKNENRGVIRVVGTLIWYSIDWGKGGERKQPVRKSLRELVDLTQLDKSSVVRALDEAERKGYVERIERGVFDLSGNQKDALPTLYGIRWTTDYTYTYDGLPVEVAAVDERSQNATRLSSVNAPKMQHGSRDRTLPKRDTDFGQKRSQNATQDTPKTRHGERSQNATKVINKTSTYKTSILNSSSSPSPASSSFAVAEELLLKTGFDKKTARELAVAFPSESITQQVEWLPLRAAKKNPLGMLRRAIEESWAAPAEIQTTDVGSFPGSVFAANFYAGYNGNPDAPVSDPSPADSEAANRFVQRLLGVSNEPSEVPAWGRSFGELVASAHGRKRQHFPALRPALQQHGDDFYSRFKSVRENERKRLLERARESHFERFKPEYDQYLRAELERNEAENTNLFQALMADEAEKLSIYRKNRFGLDVKSLVEKFTASRLERFQQFIILEEGHGVLGFWDWDKARNPERFIEATL